ncbi:MAG: NHL repeat-containing protein [Proteobacteria bacterium]|nr:NHL repeat-containing protein [Pseudomonadota bacterium]MBU1233212.1 NHL repeat-containing protein [Pseudomonadota bacterium]MBU1418317.1 NHL repeat-containing protein [Pseudomonadota bacterium]MBU1454275.1 NHL repeat-containing protein [Pseudomonadota bacterium]
MKRMVGRNYLFAKGKKKGGLVRNGLILLFVFLMMADPVYSINLTPVTHLFDIQHNFSQPSDVAVGADGFIYVVDGVNQCIKVFDSKGKFLFSFGEAGSGPGQFNYPLGMDIDGAGRLYVADSGNQRVQIFSIKGRFLNEIKVESTSGKVPDPTDVAVDSEGTEVFVVDNDNHCIYKYDLKTLKLLEVIGNAGIARMEFRYPFLISMDRDKYLYIVDVINTRVQEMTRDGKFVRFIGDWGVEKGQFFRPKGVAVDSKGRVYVSDSYMGVVQVFDEGVFHSVIGDSKKDELWRYNSPVGLFIDKKDRLYVVQMFAERVSVFQINR